MRMDVGVRAAEIDDRRNRRSGTQKSTFRKGRSSPVESTDPRLAMIPGVAAPAPPGVLQSSPAPPTEEPPAAPPARCPTNVVLPWTASVIPQDDTMSDLGQLRYFMRIDVVDLLPLPWTASLIHANGCGRARRPTGSPDRRNRRSGRALRTDSAVAPGHP